MTKRRLTRAEQLRALRNVRDGIQGLGEQITAAKAQVGTPEELARRRTMLWSKLEPRRVDDRGPTERIVAENFNRWERTRADMNELALSQAQLLQRTDSMLATQQAEEERELQQRRRVTWIATGAGLVAFGCATIIFASWHSDPHHGSSPGTT